jgi:hypothetical protein
MVFGRNESLIENSYFEKLALREFHKEFLLKVSYLSLSYLYYTGNTDTRYYRRLMKNYTNLWYVQWPSGSQQDSIRDSDIVSPYNIFYNSQPIPWYWWRELYISAMSSFGTKAVSELESFYQKQQLLGSTKYWVGYTIALALYKDNADRNELLSYLHDIITNAKDTVLIEKARALIELTDQTSD